jgi:hypothetical protein
LTLAPDATDIRERVSMADWDRGGHHPNWCTDSRHILMNLAPSKGAPIAFMQIDDQTGLARTLATGIVGSGHPTSRHGFILTDCYHHEGFRGKRGLPLRLIDPGSGCEHHPLHLYCGLPGMNARRVDPHPAWSTDGTTIVVNCLIRRKRQIVIVDANGLKRCRAERAIEGAPSPRPASVPLGS